MRESAFNRKIIFVTLVIIVKAHYNVVFFRAKLKAKKRFPKDIQKNMAVNFGFIQNTNFIYIGFESVFSFRS